MAKSIFGISVASAQLPKESIAEIAQRTIRLFKSLSRIDPVFLQPIFLGKNDADKHPLDLVNKEEATSKRSNLILKFSKGSIQKYEGVANPSVDFSRDFGFSSVYQFLQSGNKVFSFSTNFGGSSGGGMSINTFDKQKEFDFAWYYSILQKMVHNTQADYGVVSINNTAFIDLLTPLKVKYPLGWITYFSNSFKINIPGDLKNIAYDESDNGRFLILTRDDFTKTKEHYFAERERLLNSMKTIKERVPNYSQ